MVGELLAPECVRWGVIFMVDQRTGNTFWWWLITKNSTAAIGPRSAQQAAQPRQFVRLSGQIKRAEKGEPISWPNRTSFPSPATQHSQNQQQRQRSQSIAHLHHSIAKVSISALLSLSSSLCYCFYFYSSLFVGTISWFPLPDCKKRLSGHGQLLFSVFQDKEDWSWRRQSIGQHGKGRCVPNFSFRGPEARHKRYRNVHVVIWYVRIEEEGQGVHAEELYGELCSGLFFNYFLWMLTKERRFSRQFPLLEQRELRSLLAEMVATITRKWCKSLPRWLWQMGYSSGYTLLTVGFEIDLWERWNFIDSRDLSYYS